MVVKVKSHYNDNELLFIMIYEDCYFKNPTLDILDIDYNNKDSISIVELEFAYNGDFNYFDKEHLQQYDRLVKLKRILKKKRSK